MARNGGCAGMRFALGTFGSAVVLFLAGAAGVLGMWALVTGAVSLLVAGVSAAVVLEERDLRRDERLLEAL